MAEQLKPWETPRFLMGNPLETRWKPLETPFETPWKPLKYPYNPGEIPEMMGNIGKLDLGNPARFWMLKTLGLPT